MSDAQRRSLRTLIQGLLGTTGIVALWQVFAPEDWRLSGEQVAVLGPFLTMFATFVMNWLEDHGAIPSLLKAPASPGPVPLGTPVSEVVEYHPPADAPPGGRARPRQGPSEFEPSYDAEPEPPPAPTPTAEPAQENTGWGGPGMDQAEPRRPQAPRPPAAGMADAPPAPPKVG